MLKGVSIAGTVSALGLLLLSVAPVVAQSTSQGVPATFGGNPAYAPQVPPDVQVPVIQSPPIVQAGAPVVSAESCTSCQHPSAAASCGTCEAQPAGKQCGCRLCKKKKAGKPSPCAGSHKGLFYANDFSYLGKEGNTASCLGDSLKDRKIGNLGNLGTLSLGGQLRWRYHSERGQGQQAGFTRFQDTDNDFLLGRLRLYADWKVNNNIRFYAEGIYADVAARNEEYIARGIDANQGDFLNLFADINLDGRTTLRIGRQELLYGDQRLVSPLDWANTRQRFDGFRTISKFDKFKIDTWYTQFVPAVPTEFDNPDEQQHFWGVYATLTELQNKTLELYYLGLNDDRGVNETEAVHTFGTRLFGNTQRNLLYEFEGAVQNGSRDLTDQSLTAWSITGGLGYKFNNRPWKPALWFFYDYATGDEPGGSFTSFNDLFPLGHKYLGFIDAVQRQNILSPNVRLSLAPTPKLNLLLWYYNFRAAIPETPVLSLGGTPAQDTTSADFGNEIDFVATYKVNARNTFLVGYSHFFRGDRILGDTDADFLYLQWTTNF